MAELKKVIAKNISELRKSSGITQLELAEKLNYSDKAVSKWESGASVPDVSVLMDIAKIFGVTVDYLLAQEHIAPAPDYSNVKAIRRMHIVISLMSVALVWLIATAAFVILELCGVKGNVWLSFIWAVPVSSIVALVFNSLWGDRRFNFLIISVLLWSLLTGIFLSLLKLKIWLVFLIGIPGQIIIILWLGMKKRFPKKVKHEKTRKNG